MSTLERRVKTIRARARVRRWEFRQRHLAHGAWYRFRLALAHARAAYAIDEFEAHALIGQQRPTDIGGRDLEPARLIVWVTAEQAALLRTARPLALHLDAALFASPYLALVPFPGLEPPGAR